MDSLPVVDLKLRPSGSFSYRRIRTRDPNPPVRLSESGRSTSALKGARLNARPFNALLGALSIVLSTSIFISPFLIKLVPESLVRFIAGNQLFELY